MTIGVQTCASRVPPPGKRERSFLLNPRCAFLVVNEHNVTSLILFPRG